MKKVLIIFALSMAIAIFIGVHQQRNAELSRMVGQMILVGFRGATPDALPVQELANDIRAGRVGGVILFSSDVARGREMDLSWDEIRSANKVRNIVNVNQVKALNEYLQDAARDSNRPPLFISIDQEGGRVVRLTLDHDFDFIMPNARTQAADYTTEQVERMHYILSTRLRALGFNLNFAPVVDIDINPDSPAIGRLGRAFSSDPMTVVAYARAAMTGMERAGMIWSLKHFPGHGSARGDTHFETVDITNVWSDVELVPYRELLVPTPTGPGLRIAQNGMVMIAHVFNRNIDDRFPASMSYRTIEGLLRRGMNFDGVVISDDLQMGAIYQNFGLRETLKHAILAGNDIMLLGNNMTYTPNLGRAAHAEIMDLVRAGEIPRMRIVQSYNRIMKLKSRVESRR